MYCMIVKCMKSRKLSKEGYMYMQYTALYCGLGGYRVGYLWALPKQKFLKQEAFILQPHTFNS